MEKGRDLVGVKGGGESNLCVQLVAPPERERGRVVGGRSEGWGEDERWMVDTELY